MPMPIPLDGETQGAFIARGMDDKSLIDEMPDRGQRSAALYKAWRTWADNHASDEVLVVDADQSTDATSHDRAEVMDAKTGTPDPHGIYSRKVEDAKLVVLPFGKTAGSIDAGWIEGYSAVFGNVDAQGERIAKGAFAKTIRERVPAGKVKLTVLHFCNGGDVKEVIGTVTDAKEDEYGLWSHFELSSVPLAQETRAKVAEGHVNNLSVGYMVKGSQVVKDGQGKAIRELTELVWLETQVTATPANVEAVITAAKTICQTAKILSSDASGKTDRDREQVEACLKAIDQVKADLVGLIRSPQPEGKATTVAAPVPPLQDWATAIERHRLDLLKL